MIHATRSTGTTSRMRKPSCVHLRTSPRNTVISSYVSSPWPWPTMGNFGLSTCSTLMFAGPSGVSRAGRSRRSTRLIRLPGTRRTMPSDLRRVNGTFAGSAPRSTSCAAEKERFPNRRTVMATDELIVRDALRCGRPVVHRWGDGSIGSDSGRRLRAGCRARMLGWWPVCRRRSARGGSARMAGCRQAIWPRCRDAICREATCRKSACQHIWQHNAATTHEARIAMIPSSASALARIPAESSRRSRWRASWQGVSRLTSGHVISGS